MCEMCHDKDKVVRSHSSHLGSLLHLLDLFGASCLGSRIHNSLVKADRSVGMFEGLQLKQREVGGK